MKKWLFLSGLAITLSTGSPLWAADPEHGMALHEESCLGCHAARHGGDNFAMYTRPERKVKSLAKLEKMVSFCNQQVGAGWFPEDEQDVADYLNKHFYQLK